MRIVSVLVENFAHFDVFFPETQCIVATEKGQLKEGDIVILHGGGDIHESFYTPPDKIKTTQPVGKTDLIESAIIDEAVEKGCFLFGICKGAQWLCVKAGGSLFNHIEKHPQGNHIVQLLAQEECMVVTSSHHQMMCVNDLPKEDFEVMGIYPGMATVRHHLVKHQSYASAVNPDVEVVYFPKINGFACQSHPEWQPSNHPFVLWCIENACELWDVEIPCLTDETKDV